jgi:uncharacterized protein (DUF1499 family)
MTDSALSRGAPRSLVAHAPRLALGLAALSLLLLALAPLGWRLGLWHFRFSFFTLMTWSGYIAIAAAAAAVITLIALGGRLSGRGKLEAAAALLLGLGLIYVPWQWDRIRTTVPPIHDITTDTENPPAFQAVLPARKAENANTEVYGGPDVAKAQKGAYADIAPVSLPLPAAEAFKKALDTAKAMSGWMIVASDPQSGRIEASQSSFWFGFTDDVVIRVTADGAGSRIDMRSEARQGRSDFGKNAERVRKYLAALKG